MVEAARERSNNRCECDGRCGSIHRGGRCNVENGKPHPQTGSIVVLTLAHFHGVALEETSIERMMHACQRCHNKYDAPMRLAGIRSRFRSKAAIGDLFDE